MLGPSAFSQAPSCWLSQLLFVQTEPRGLAVGSLHIPQVWGLLFIWLVKILVSSSKELGSFMHHSTPNCLPLLRVIVEEGP